MKIIANILIIKNTPKKIGKQHLKSPEQKIPHPMRPAE